MTDVIGIVLLRLALLSGQLHRLMAFYPFAKVLGNAGRVAAWRKLGAEVADHVDLGPGVRMRGAERISIGAGSRLSGRIYLDGWGRIDIGRNVLMNDQVDILTAQHDLDSPMFDGDIRTVSIGDHAWLPLRIIVLPGVSIGTAAVVGSGSVVAADVPDYAVFAGNPARFVKERARIDFEYVPSQF
jgi:acetyltransferase-like isoleucine patch superfamily enzyme